MDREPHEESPRSQTGAVPPKRIIGQDIDDELGRVRQDGSLLLSETDGASLLLSAVEEGNISAENENALKQELLVQARKALDQLPPDEVALPGFVHNDSLALSLVLSEMAERRAERGGPGVLKEVVGTDQYELLDPGWAGSVINRLTHGRVAFRAHGSLQDFRVPLEEEVVAIALVGDWGTGLPTSNQIVRQVAALKPSITIHLGDVYYSGTKHEVQTRFLPNWPAGSIATFALNSNHEMYAGGEGYFDVSLASLPFQRHQAASYFCISLPGWQVIGLDSAYEAPDLLYQKGRLSGGQIEWLQAQLSEGARLGKKSIVLTHHNPLDLHGGTDDGLLHQMLEAASPNPFQFWYWAHEHAGARFAPYGPAGRQFLGRCVGHGGVPYAPEKAGTLASGANVEWTETELANDPVEPRRARNGFVLLRLNSKTKTLEETFVDEFGKVKSTFFG